MSFRLSGFLTLALGWGGLAPIPAAFAQTYYPENDRAQLVAVGRSSRLLDDVLFTKIEGVGYGTKVAIDLELSNAASDIVQASLSNCALIPAPAGLRLVRVGPKRIRLDGRIRFVENWPVNICALLSDGTYVRHQVFFSTPLAQPAAKIPAFRTPGGFDAVAGRPFRGVITVDKTPKAKWVGLTDGTLPKGLAFSTVDGVYAISGTPTEASVGAFTFTIVLEDDRIVQESFLVKVSSMGWAPAYRLMSPDTQSQWELVDEASPRIFSDGVEMAGASFRYFPRFTAGQSLGNAFEVVGTKSAVTEWSINPASPLPEGLQLKANGATARLEGKLNVSGIWAFQVRAKLADGRTVAQNYLLQSSVAKAKHPGLPAPFYEDEAVLQLSPRAGEDFSHLISLEGATAFRDAKLTGAVPAGIKLDVWRDSIEISGQTQAVGTSYAALTLEKLDGTKLSKQVFFEVKAAPVYQPPTYEPPTYEPPTYEPPVYEPPTYEPPVYEPVPDRAAEERERREREERERAETERMARERAEAERVARDRAARERAENERREREGRERAENERREREGRERAENERREREGRERGENERRAREAAERAARERAEAERMARERGENERREREGRERAENERREREGRQRAENERSARERAEAERVARERAEAERVARERSENERRARETAERAARERAEAERAARERAENERAARERAENERRARETAERAARERAEAERVARERAEAERREREGRERAENERREREGRERAENERREREGRERAENERREREGRERAENERRERERAGRPGNPPQAPGGESGSGDASEPNRPGRGGGRRP